MTVRSAVARALGCCLVLVAALAGCTGDSSSSSPTPETTSPATNTSGPPVELTFGVYGSTEDQSAPAVGI